LDQTPRSDTAGKSTPHFPRSDRLFFGNIPFVVLALISLAAVAFIFWKRGSPLKINNLTIIVVSFFAILEIIGLLATMIARHPEVYSIRDHEFWYYTLSIHVVILFGLTAWTSSLSPNVGTRWAPVFYTLIGILIVLNIRGYERQRQAITTGN